MQVQKLLLNLNTSAQLNHSQDFLVLILIFIQSVACSVTVYQKWMGSRGKQDYTDITKFKDIRCFQQDTAHPTCFVAVFLGNHRATSP